MIEKLKLNSSGLSLFLRRTFVAVFAPLTEFAAAVAPATVLASSSMSISVARLISMASHRTMLLASDGRSEGTSAGSPFEFVFGAAAFPSGPSAKNDLDRPVAPRSNRLFGFPLRPIAHTNNMKGC